MLELATLEILRRCRRCGDEALARRLRAAGVSARPFTRDALLLAAEVFGKRERRTAWRLRRSPSREALSDRAGSRLVTRPK